MKKLLQISLLLIVVLALIVTAVACDYKKERINPNESNEFMLDFTTVYAFAEEAGYTGTMEDLIELFKGENAYQLAVAAGYAGTEQDWLSSLVGAAGKDGVTPSIGENKHWYIGDVDTGVLAEGQKGEKGDAGEAGVEGKSAYELAVENGYFGTLAEWLASLVGQNGEQGIQGPQGEKGDKGEKGDNGEDGKDGQNGQNGQDGVSVVNAYINDEIHLILVLSNGTEIDAGYVGVNMTPSIKTYTVTFVDYDGTILKTETVEEGDSATAPSDPTRDGYMFIGWDKDYDNINDETTITATYEQNITNPTFIVEKVNAEAGQSGVTVTVALKNNPGISSIALSVAYDDGITLTGFTYNSSEIGGQSTPYNANVASPRLVWVNWTENVEGDWVFATLIFNVNEHASGTYNIYISYNADDVYDVDENNVTFDIADGNITVA